MATVYSSGAAAYRDATKWLVAFVPTASVIGAGVAVVPGLVRTAHDDDLVGFFSTQFLSLVGLAVVVAGVWRVIASGADVLAAQPVDMRSAITPKDGTSDPLTVAFGQGLGLPYYFDVDNFRDDLRKLTGGTLGSDSEEAKRAFSTVEVAREWALQQRLESLWTAFQRNFVIGVALVVAGFVAAVAGLPPDSAEPTIPTRAQLVDLDIDATLTSVFGCADAVLWKVDGTWDEPVLEADGSGCSTATWSPSAEVEVRPLANEN